MAGGNNPPMSAITQSVSELWLCVRVRVCVRSCSRLEIMEQMAVLQETSYEQLYRWAQSEYST